MKKVWVAFLCGLLLVIGGCPGTETGEKVTATVETVTGKESLEHYQQMKDELTDIQVRQADHLRQLDDADDSR